MGSNHKNTGNSRSIDNPNYLYRNGNRIIKQIRCLKASKDKGFRPYKAA